ncbi:Uncharacterised protein [Chlamydia trachomatis]|nr:Uncharacterised protein [Chlamydia trachomatis]
MKPGFNVDFHGPKTTGAMLMSLARVTTEGHMDILDLSQYLRSHYLCAHGPCCHWRSSWSLHSDTAEHTVQLHNHSGFEQ